MAIEGSLSSLSSGGDAGGGAPFKGFASRLQEEDKKRRVQAAQRQIQTAKGVLRLQKDAKQRVANWQANPTPDQPSLIENIAKPVIDIGRGLADTARVVVSPGPTRSERTGVSVQQLVEAQKKAQKLPPELKSRIGQYGPSVSAQALAMVNRGSRPEEISKYLDKQETLNQQGLKALGTAAELSSYAVGGGSLVKAAKVGGARQVAKTAATTAGAGFTGGAGMELGAGEQDISNILTTGAIGAGAGLAGSAALSGIGAGARAIKGAKPVQKLDEAVKSGSSRAFDAALATTPGQKLKEGLRFAQTKLQNSTAPINRQLNELQSAGKLTENQVKNVKSLIQTSRTSTYTLSQDFLANDEAAQTLFAPVNGSTLAGKSKAAISDYINARNELNLINLDAKRGVKISPTRKARFEKIVQEFDTPEMQARYDADVAVNQKLTDMLVEEGIVSPAQRDAWRKTNTEYIRVQRLLDGKSEMRGGGGGKAPASRGSTIASQKRKGSTKEALDAFDVLTDRTNRVMQEISSNRAANAYIEALNTAGVLGKPLRNAEDVAMRQELRDALRFSRPLKKQLERYESSQLGYVRRIQNELNKLNRLGLDESLSKPLPDETLAGKLADPGAKMTKQELKSVLDNIVQNTDTKVLQRVRKGVAKREPKLAKAIEELEDIQTSLSGVNAQRLEQFREIGKRADKEVRGRPTIQRMVNGVKEIYETTPEIELAAKGMGPVYMGTLGRIISSPVRLLQSTITGGLNPAWVAIALPRDFIEGVVLSRHARQTHNPINVVASVLEMAGVKQDEGELFQKFMSYERGSSAAIDLTKSAKDNARIARELSRQQLPKVKRGIEVVKTPRDWYETLQNASKWNEQATKYQNFRGTYNTLIKESVDPEEAFNIALYEGRNATGNLLETGDWTRALASVYPYFNPAIQGGASLARSFKNRPVATSAKIATAVQIPAAIATAWNLSDPRRAEIYLDISPEERERYNIVVLPGTEKSGGKWGVFKIPKPPGVGNLANPVERFMTQMYGEDPGGFENIAQSVVKAFGSPIDPGTASSALGSITPHQVKPLIEGVANYSFYKGKPIVPDWIKEENPDEPFKQAYSNTSSTYKKIGQALGISPLIVQNFANSTLGEFGRNATFLSDYAQELSGAEGVEVGGRSPVESVTRGYYGAVGGVEQSNVTERINKAVSGKTKISKDITEALLRDDYEAANQLANEHNKYVDEISRFVNKKSGVRKLSDKQKKLLENMKFPMEEDGLSQRSIASRLKQDEDE